MRKIALTLAVLAVGSMGSFAQPAVPVVKGAQSVSQAEEARVTGKGVSVKSPGKSGNLHVKVKL